MWNCEDILSVIHADEYVMFHLLQFHLQEMADPRLRGTLSACIILTHYIGSTLISPIVFNISRKMSAGLGACIALIDLVGYSFLHESPVWYVRNNRISDARKVFSWLWGSEHHAQVRLTHPLYIYRTADTLQQVTLLCMIQIVPLKGEYPYLINIGYLSL